MECHILMVLYDLESHAKDGRCGLFRNEDIRRFVGKFVEKQTLGPQMSKNRLNKEKPIFSKKA